MSFELSRAAITKHHIGPSEPHFELHQTIATHLRHRILALQLSNNAYEFTKSSPIWYDLNNLNTVTPNSTRLTNRPATSRPSHRRARPPHARRAQERRNPQRPPRPMRYLHEPHPQRSCADKSRRRQVLPTARMLRARKQREYQYTMLGRYCDRNL